MKAMTFALVVAMAAVPCAADNVRDPRQVGVKSQVVVVRMVNDDAVQSGRHLVDTLDAITDASPAKPYLVVIEPGVYYLTNSDVVRMKDYVDIQGSGRDVTVISRAGFSTPNTGTVVGADNSSMSNLTVNNLGTTAIATAIYNEGVSPRFSHIDVIAEGGTSQNIGITNFLSSPVTHDLRVNATGGEQAWGVYNNNCSPHLRDLDVHASDASAWSFAIYNYNGAHPTIEQSTLKVSGPGNGHVIRNSPSASVDLVGVTAVADMGGEGLAVYSLTNSEPRTMRILHSTLVGGFAAMSGGDPNLVISVGASQLSGGIYNDFDNAVYRCAGVFDGDFVALDEACQ